MARTDSIISRLPYFFQSGDRLNNLYRWVEVFGKQVDIAEEDLIRVMRSHWVNTANNEDSKGFDTAEKGDLDKIFALYLEALGGTSLLRQRGRRSGEDGLEDDKIYRERIKGLIGVLRDGASTKEGIIAIVAANLGIVGDSQEAKDARATIRIEEFLPIAAPIQTFAVDLFQEFEAKNDNHITQVPQINVRIIGSLPTPLVNPTITNLETGESAMYVGQLHTGEELVFLTTGEATIGGVIVPIVGNVPKLLSGFNTLRFEAGYGMPAGRFDQNVFNFSLFDQSVVTYPGRFDESEFDESSFSEAVPVVDIDVRTQRLHPGVFDVRIPWDIPGYTELLDSLSDEPREQIGFIVDKVKAAGTLAIITYEKTFPELQEQVVDLTLRNQFPDLDQEMQELSFSSGTISTPYPSGIYHEHQDSLTLSGVFDFTTFDSLNTFA